MRLGVALIALAIAAATAYLGRRDLSRPAVVFGVTWFTFVAAAQLQLTPVESAWSVGFAATTVGGGLAFMLGAFAASGTSPARGELLLDRQRYNAEGLLAIAVLLMLGGVAGWIYKNDLLGGIPLLSSHIDVLRGTAFENGGVPAWASALTGGFYIAFWLLSVVAYLKWKSAGLAYRVALVVLAGGALFGVALDASRNLVLLAVSVPLIGAYLVSPRVSRRGAGVRVGAAVLVLALIVGGAFVARLAQTSRANAGNAFVKHELRAHSPLLRPFIPIYINGVLPLDGSQALRSGIPDHAPWGRGTYSLLSLPGAAFPDGKPEFGGIVAGQLASRGAGFWTVSSYQGRAFGDYGTSGVVVASLLMGLIFGSAYRFARRRGGLLAVVLIGYVAYYTAYLIYDNLLSFTLIAFYDLAVVFAAERLALSQAPWEALRKLAPAR